MTAVFLVLAASATAFASVANLTGSTGAMTWASVLSLLGVLVARYQPLTPSNRGVQ